MCDEKNIQTFPSRVIGGATGDYLLQCDILNGRVTEFQIVSIANGDAGVSKVFVSGQSKEAARALNWVGGVTLNDDNHAYGQAYSLAASTSIFAPLTEWERVTHSQKKLFVRIDTVNSNSVFVTIRFRVKDLEIVPGPAVTAHPDHMQQLNIARADATRQRLGMDKEIAEGESLNARR